MNEKDLDRAADRAVLAVLYNCPEPVGLDHILPHCERRGVFTDRAFEAVGRLMPVLMRCVERGYELTPAGRASLDVLGTFGP